MTEEMVLFETYDNGVATITLNNPKTLNALTLDMIKPILDRLKAWRTDNSVQLIVLEGSGPKGFSSGADMKSIYYTRQNADALEENARFFALEYELDQLIASFPKPIVALMDGVVMGGGAGLTYGASYRLVTERTKWAMPEMNIGFFPDVGAGYFLNQAPGYIGRYLALTAEVLGAADVLYIGAADYYVTSEQINIIKQDILKMNWLQNDQKEKINHLLQSYARQPEQTGVLSQHQQEIDRYFSLKIIEDIINALANSDTAFAKETHHKLLSKSPVSLKVALAHLIKAEKDDLSDCLRKDYILANNFMKHGDFYEGVRSVLIDKDKKPDYTYQYLTDVSDALVESFFKK